MRPKRLINKEIKKKRKNLHGKTGYVSEEFNFNSDT